MFCYLICFIVFVYLFNRLICGYAKNSKCLVGKTALVTGGNTGIGFQICLILASRGCRVIIANRSSAEAARKEIIRRTGNTNIETKTVDLRSFQSVRQLAKDICATESRLHLLINNAGIGGSDQKLTEDGFDETIQVNHLSPFLLTFLLKDLLAKSKPSRVVFTASISCYLGHTDPKWFAEQPRGFPCGNAQPYCNSKLLVILACKVMAREWKHLGISCYSTHPGTVFTNIFHRSANANTRLWMLPYIFRLLTWWYGRSEWEGAQTAIHVACSETVENESGEYYQDCKKIFKPWQYWDKKICRQVWNYTIDCVGLPPIDKI